MDSVRLGRALGAGTRRLAQTVAEVSQAVTAPGPSENPAAAPVRRAASAPVATRNSQVRESTPPTPAPRKAFLRPLQRFTATLWLEVTGTFFVIFCLMMGAAAWRYRAAWRGAVDGEGKLYVYAAFMLLFGYFAASSFVRANRRK